MSKMELNKYRRKIVVIGAGNAAMDVIIEAYNCGAKKLLQ